MDGKRIIQDCEQLSAHKFEYLHETDQLLKKYNLPKLTQGKTDTLNRPMSIKETESIMNNFLKQKAPDPDGFTNEFDQTLKEEMIPILYNVFQKTEAEGNIFQFILRGQHYSNTKPDKGITGKENYRPVSLINTDIRILNKILTNQIQQCTNRIIYIMAKWGLFQL